MGYWQPQINFQVLVNGKRISSHTSLNAARKVAQRYGQSLFGNDTAEIVDVNTGAIHSAF